MYIYILCSKKTKPLNAVKIRRLLLDKSLRCAQREFSYKSPGERILKIGPHLPKLLSNIKGLGFFWNTVHIYIANHTRLDEIQVTLISTTQRPNTRSLISYIVIRTQSKMYDKRCVFHQQMQYIWLPKTININSLLHAHELIKMGSAN